MFAQLCLPLCSPMEMATHSSILAWRIPWTEEPGMLQSTGLQRVRHDTFFLSFFFSFFSAPWTTAHQAPLSMGFPRQGHWSGCHFLLQGILLTQGSKLHLLCLLHCRWILYHCSISPNRKIVWHLSWESNHFVTVYVFACPITINKFYAHGVFQIAARATTYSHYATIPQANKAKHFLKEKTQTPIKHCIDPWRCSFLSNSATNLSW